MTDRAQFEAMLEALINEDQETAKEIFHNIVVGKSREIYEELLESDFSGPEEEDEEEADTEANPFGNDEEDDEFGGEDEEGEEDEFGGEDEEGEEDGDLGDRVLDLEDSLKELQAEFDELLAGEKGEPEHAGMFGGDETGEEDEFGGEEDEFGGEEDEFGGEMDDDDSKVKEVQITHKFEKPEENEFQKFMEYVNKVALPQHGNNGDNTKSVIDNMKNDMGGTTSNIAQNFSTTTGGTKGGLAKSETTLQDGGNINKPGANAGKTAFKTREPGGFGANKGHKLVGAGTGDTGQGTAVNNQSIAKRLGK